ncbi:methyltransferase domain-containing protein [Nocardioides sp. R-C-SC26]|uniref:methyltransferase domain-containing protein n=1 Tax=Nocardioides sp. R-C-SC26 TaxID=2870414 RepID=UPI001E5FE7E5|nr:methyltransferase domain-containing protein [Nocardioides sp. R-C-SC26]
MWSFWAERDTAEAEDGAPRGSERRAAWPRPLRRFLHGRTRVRVRAHVADVDLYDAEHVFGDPERNTEADGRVRVVNVHGAELALDKSGRLQVTFDTRDASQVAPLLDSIEEVIDALDRAGVQAFPAYGTLLGAVRDGALIGHDSDADLGYVSRFSHPIDVIRESFALQRRLRGMGYAVTRYSGAGFKVDVVEADGTTRGLDVFGGYLDDGFLILLGEIRTPFERSWIFPLATTTLEGRDLPAPADADRVLTATYGPHWRTPDPAFKFETPRSTTDRLNDWFRGTTAHRSTWDRKYQLARFAKPQAGPDPLARMLMRQERTLGSGIPDLVVDVGCGRGHTSRWLARRGAPTLGLDYSPRGYEFVARQTADEPGLPLEFAPFNLLELRSTLAWGARIAQRGGHRVALARHVADCLPDDGREHLWRFLALACSGGGRSYLDFLMSPVEDDRWAQRNLLAPLEEEQVRAEVEARGGRVVIAKEIGSPRMGVRGANDTYRALRRSCRMVVAWD